MYSYKKDNCGIKLTALHYVKINEIEKFILVNYFIYFIIAKKQLVLWEIFKMGNRNFHIISCVLHFFMVQKDPLHSSVINPGLWGKEQVPHGNWKLVGYERSGDKSFERLLRYAWSSWHLEVEWKWKQHGGEEIVVSEEILVWDFRERQYLKRT